MYDVVAPRRSTWRFARLSESLLRLAEACTHCRTEEDFARVIETEVQQLLPHRMSLAVLGRVDLDRIEIFRLLAAGYPAHAVPRTPRSTPMRDKPLLWRWLRTREPVVLHWPDDAALISAEERDEIEQFGLDRIAVHGVVDLNARAGSCFSFGRIPRELPTDALKHLLRLIVPYLHQALLSVHHQLDAGVPVAPCDRLSPVERELLRWVSAGRTNAEIASIRGRSAATVRNQLSALFKKLEVSNRAEAVRALDFSRG